MFFLGASERVNLKAKQVLEAKYKVRVVGFASPRVDVSNLDELTPVVERIKTLRPQLVLVALGAPKQEYVMAHFAKALAPSTLLGIGATLDFIAGEVRRAPELVSRVGLEWLYRLIQEPKRLAHRYLVRDRAIAKIFLRMLLQ